MDGFNLVYHDSCAGAAGQDGAAEDYVFGYASYRMMDGIGIDAVMEMGLAWCVAHSSSGCLYTGPRMPACSRAARASADM